METIDIIAVRLKQDFDFMLSRGYAFNPVEVYNPNNPARIFARLSFRNNSLNRELVFTIYPRNTTEIEIFITDCNTDLSMNFKHYIEFKKGNPPRHTPEFIVDEGNLTQDVDELSAYIRSLIQGDLKDVVFGKEWITFPTYDPRDAY